MVKVFSSTTEVGYVSSKKPYFTGVTGYKE